MIFDVKTKNISFLKVSKLLRERGVKNNKFMLALYDEGLRGLDPRSKKVAEDPELQLRILREITNNIWYFIREVVLIPAEGQDVPYELNLGNCTLTYLREKNRNIMCILPRQSGKTMGEAVFEVWNTNFVTRNTTVTYLNKAKPDAIKNLKLIRDIRELLPEWMKEKFVVDRKNDIDNQELKLIAKRNNTIRVASGGSDPDSSEKAGRGLTTANVIFDEFAFLKYNDLIYKACQPAFKRASENAKKKGMPYGMVLLTTPNQKDVAAGAFAYSVYTGTAKWRVDCFDFDDAEVDAFVQNNSQNDFILVEYSYKELGRSEEWLKEQIRQMIGDVAKVKREILLEWPRSMESSVFSEEDLDKIYQFVKTPVAHMFSLNKQFCIDMYEPLDFNRNYILSCDVAGGLSQDNSVIDIIDPEDFRVVADFRNNKIDTDSFKNLIKELLTFFFKNAVLVIERNSYGLVIIDNLRKDPLIEPRMYRETRESLGEKQMNDGFTVKKKSSTVIYGVDTNTQSRKKMFDLLPEIVETEYDKFVSPHIYGDIAGLEKKKTGKIEHSTGGHDDSLMAYLIFRYAVFYGKCFRDRFGIYPTPSKVNVRTTSSNGDISRIINFIEQGNAAADRPLGSAMYDSLADKEQKLKSEDDKQLDAFLRVTNLNKW